ncbi:MAG: rhomboid family intramembrane serine protease [Flavobacterium psychrophilum]|nr:MAG: rhomboid family intramembrane serine protease [Flavobacterium psychrophilum]
MMRITETVKQLIIINILFFVGTLFVGEPAQKILALHFPLNSDFKIWQPLTYMFMHGGVMHILFNMLGLWMFGSLLESIWGSKKFIFFYVSCGVGAALLHIGINYITFYQGLSILQENGFDKGEVLTLLAEGRYNPEWGNILNPSQFSNFMGAYVPTVGASGAIYGIMVAFAFMFPNAELMLLFLPIPIKAKYFVPGLLAYDLIMGVKGQAIFGGGDGVAHFAHLGGALIGFIMMWYWNKNQFNKNRWN